MTCNAGWWFAVALNVAVAGWNLWAGIGHLRAKWQFRELAREVTDTHFPGASVLKHLESDKKEQ